MENVCHKALEDGIIVIIEIRVNNYKPYFLDTQMVFGAMSCCEKYGAIMSYHWQKINMQFRVWMVPINGIGLDFPIILNGEKTFVSLYYFDIGTYVLLGQDFVNKHLPMTI